MEDSRLQPHTSARLGCCPLRGFSVFPQLLNPVLMSTYADFALTDMCSVWTFLITVTWGCYWHLLGGGQGCCVMSRNADGNLPYPLDKEVSVLHC